MNTAEVISEEAFSRLRQIDELVRIEARQIHAEHSRFGSDAYRDATLRGAYDADEDLAALRAAIRRGIEIGRAS